MLKFDTTLDIKPQLLQGINKMSLKSKLKQVFVITGISVAALVTAPAMAAPMISLDITGGCFSSGTGTDGATGCGNTDSDHKEYATGSFVFTNSLSEAFNPGDDGAFSAFANLSATNGNPADDLNDIRSQSFPTFTALTSDLLWGPASGLVFAIGASPDMGSVSVAPFGSISWENTLDAGPTPTNVSGSFIFFSDDDLNGLSQTLFDRPLPVSEVDFTAEARLSLVEPTTPITEPITLSLLGLGLFSMVVLRRRISG